MDSTNVHDVDGVTISLYQDDGGANWPMTYASRDAMMRYGINNGNYDSFSDDSGRSQSDQMDRMNISANNFVPSNEQLTESTHLLTSAGNPYQHEKSSLPDTRFGEGFIGKYSNYNQKLTNVHVWSIVFIKSLDHIGRKFFEYFAYFLAYSYFDVNSFYMFAWCVAAIDFAAILSIFILPFIIDKSPKKLQMILQSLIGKSIIAMAFWKGFTGLFILRFVFGLAYSLLLSIWSYCVAAFIPHAKQARAVSKIELSWAIASFSFILVAWVLDHSGVNLILYVLGICGIICACVLGAIMPSSKLIFAEYDREHVFEMTRSMFVDILFGDLASITFLCSIGLVSFTNMMLTICLAPWFIKDYELTLTEFGYTTVILGTAQLTSIIFSGQFRTKLGTGWSMVAGILVQFFMFVLLLLFNNHGMIVTQFSNGGKGHYTFPLLIILLFLCVHYIAAEFTFINASTAMMQMAPSKTSQTVASNCLRLVSSGARIIGAILGVMIWESGAFRSVILIGTVCLGCALALSLFLMGYLLKENALTEIHLRELRGEEEDSIGSDDNRFDELDMAQMKRYKNNQNALLSSDENDGNGSSGIDNESNESGYGDIDESISDDQQSFVNERLDVQAILNDIDNFQHNVEHVNNLHVL